MPTGNFKPVCEFCRDTGYYGDNGPGRRGNAEWHECDQCERGAKLKPEPMVPLRLVDEIQKEANHILRVLGGGHFLNAGEINGLMAAIRAAREGVR